ncbi:MarR family transcriptional regulator [Nocardiopsis composta]
MAGGRPLPGEIAGRLGLATPTVTRTVTRMEGSGLVERHPHPTDARLVSVRLTERGRGCAPPWTRR